MSFRLGLTGSIGMGKSTTAGMFAKAGVPVWDADAAVHRLYAAGQAGSVAIAQLCPEAIGPDGGVARDRLRAHIEADRTLLDRVNAAIHPLVAADRARFVAAHMTAPILVLDIPLLFEARLEAECEAIVVVTAPADVQRARVLARGLSVPELDAILARQLPDLEKRARADYVIHTTSVEVAEAAVKDVLADISCRIARHA